MIPAETPLLTESELAELPVFPLPNAVLFPGASIGLHLFEPRYRAMMRHCLEHGPRAMAIAMLKPGYEKDYERQPAIHEVAGAGRIVSHRGNPDGTFDLILEGTQRVRLHELAFHPPFRRARAETLVDTYDDEAAWGTAFRRAGIAALIARIPRASSVPIAPPGLDGPPGRVLDVFADAVTRDPARRQTLLETLDVETRWKLVTEWANSDVALQFDRARWEKAN